MDKWVLVTEKLPTKEGLYIVTMDGEIAGQKEPFASTNYFENGQWGDWILGDFMKNSKGERL